MRFSRFVGANVPVMPVRDPAGELASVWTPSLHAGAGVAF